MSERWLEISVPVEASEVDDVRAVLARWAGTAVAVEAPPPAGSPEGADAVVRAYLPDGPECALTRFEIQRALWHLGATGARWLREPVERWLEPEQYLHAWRDFYQPHPIGRRHLVVPSWSDAPATGRTVIRLDPGMAFGTGLHPTTRLAVEALEETVAKGDTVLDVGTGSGILAIVAALQGARHVEAFDTDADGVRTAERNVAANGCASTVRVTHGRLRPPKGRPADVLVANLVADTHLEQMGAYRAAVRPDAPVVLGGVVREREEEVVGAAAARGFRLEHVRRSGDWSCIIVA